MLEYANGILNRHGQNSTAIYARLIAFRADDNDAIAEVDQLGTRRFAAYTCSQHLNVSNWHTHTQSSALIGRTQDRGQIVCGVCLGARAISIASP